MINFNCFQACQINLLSRPNSTKLSWNNTSLTIYVNFSGKWLKKIRVAMEKYYPSELQASIRKAFEVHYQLLFLVCHCSDYLHVFADKVYFSRKESQCHKD